MNHVAAACAALLVALASPARGASTPDFHALTKLIQQTKDATAYPSGTAVAVVKDGEVIYQGYFGFADMQARTPVTRDTVFYIASDTKPFFALNVLMKEAAGQLDTHMSLQQMFPATRFSGIDAQVVTLRDLLVHDSGIDNQPLAWATAFSGIHDEQSLTGLVATSRADPEAARGEFKYTNVGYNIASVWLDRRFAMPWQTQLQRAIFQPLGMRHTSAFISQAEAAGWPLAKPYSFISTQPREPLYLRKFDDTMQAAGGLVSTAPDLARFLLAQLAVRDDSFAHAVIERSQQPQVKLDARYMDFPRSGYAWGWYTGIYKGHTLLHHFGSFAGFHTQLSFMPDAHIGLVVLSNEDFLGAQLGNLIADYVYGTLLHQPGITAEVTRRFEQLQAKARTVPAMVARQRAAIASRPWKLSLPRTAYAGTYSTPLLGDMSVTLGDRQSMLIRWGRVASTATAGVKPDQVRVEFAPGTGNFLGFAVKDGAVAAIEFENMVFERAR
ncbi:serine hydrolase domain-containing protein [Rhodanobacter ginsengiterrae]|uniref:serine hydrolase domain-containing protein n=1 Tax=Rhodanobacter ginsengiterrae TaxID=2008451 RepID=UPI003CF6B8C3